MPNWCSNVVTVYHEDPGMINRAKKAFERGEFFNEFVPVPQDLKETMSGSHSDPVEQLKLEAQTQSNLEKYGYGNWYDFNISEWGTKWDVGGDSASDVAEDGLSATFYFDSAWSPPIKFYEALQELGFTVNAMYYESGMGYAGMFDEFGDEYYEFSRHSSSEVAEMLPPDLDAMFGISETMAEYEDLEPLTEWYTQGVDDKGLKPHE